MHHGHTRCINTCSDMGTRALLKEPTIQHRIQNTKIFLLGKMQQPESFITSHEKLAIKLHQKCQYAEGCLVKSEEDLCHKHHNQEARTQRETS